VLGMFKLVFGTSILSELAGLVAAAIVYGIALRTMGLDAEERLVINRVRKRAFRKHSKSE
jgi:hypothetical protein